MNISRWFELNRPDEKYYFLESCRPLPDFPKGKYSLVLFGDFIFSFAEWVSSAPHGECKFYVLGTKAKEVLIHFFPESKNCIEVIDRYELYPVAESPNEFPTTLEPWQLVFSGRLSPSKNIGLLLHLTSSLQRKGEKVKLLLIGEFDNSQDIRPWEKDLPAPYSKLITDLIDELEWCDKPTVIRGENPHSWTRHLTARSVFVSLSDYYSEDFGVSLAQSQERGIPVIISEVGGHCDVKGSSVMKIPSHFIHDRVLRESLDDWTYDRIRADLISNFVHQRKFSATQITCEDFDQEYRPASHFAESLAKLGKQGVCLQNSYKYIGRLLKPYPGLDLFWQAYHSRWGSQVPADEAVVISATASTWGSFPIALRAIIAHWFSGQSEKNRTCFLSTGIPGALNPRKFSHLKRIVFIGFHASEVKLFEFCRDFFPKIQILIYCLEQPSRFFPNFTELGIEDSLSTSDMLIATGKTDVEMTRESFSNAQIAQANFFTPPRFKRIPFGERKGDLHFFYAGRVSEQKGLHYLITALFLLREVKGIVVKLQIGGSEDHLGVPTRRIFPRGYLNFLKHLVRGLGLHSQVEFLGKLSNEEVLRKLSETKCCFVSPSLHSDDNFSLAVMEALAHGAPTLISRWGGFEDFASAYGQGLNGVNVYRTPSTLLINCYELMREMANLLSRPISPVLINKLPPHLEVVSPQKTDQKLESTLGRRQWLLKKKKSVDNIHCIISSDEQLYLQKTWSNYGALKATMFDSLFEYALTPWTLVETDVIRVNDPLLNVFTIFRKEELKEIGVFSILHGRKFFLSHSEASELLELGQLMQMEV